MTYEIVFADSVKAHLQVLTATKRATVLEAIERKLTNEPLAETRNRKPLRPNPIAPWELRVGSLRVFSDVSEGRTAYGSRAGGWRQRADRAADRRPGDTTVKTIKLSEASQALAEYVAGRRDEVVVLTERNKPVAALVPLGPADWESVELSGHPEFLNLIERSRAEFRGGHTLSLEEMKQEFPSPRSPKRRLQPLKARRRPTPKRGTR